MRQRIAFLLLCVLATNNNLGNSIATNNNHTYPQVYYPQDQRPDGKPSGSINSDPARNSRIGYEGPDASNRQQYNQRLLKANMPFNPYGPDTEGIQGQGQSGSREGPFNPYYPQGTMVSTAPFYPVHEEANSTPPFSIYGPWPTAAMAQSTNMPFYSPESAPMLYNRSNGIGTMGSMGSRPGVPMYGNSVNVSDVKSAISSPLQSPPNAYAASVADRMAREFNPQNYISQLVNGGGVTGGAPTASFKPGRNQMVTNASFRPRTEAAGEIPLFVDNRTFPTGTLPNFSRRIGAPGLGQTGFSPFEAPSPNVILGALNRLNEQGLKIQPGSNPILDAVIRRFISEDTGALTARGQAIVASTEIGKSAAAKSPVLNDVIKGTIPAMDMNTGYLSQPLQEALGGLGYNARSLDDLVRIVIMLPQFAQDFSTIAQKAMAPGGELSQYYGGGGLGGLGGLGSLSGFSEASLIDPLRRLGAVSELGDSTLPLEGVNRMGGNNPRDGGPDVATMRQFGSNPNSGSTPYYDNEDRGARRPFERGFDRDYNQGFDVHSQGASYPNSRRDRNDYNEYNNRQYDRRPDYPSRNDFNPSNRGRDEDFWYRQPDRDNNNNMTINRNRFLSSVPKDPKTPSSSNSNNQYDQETRSFRGGDKYTDTGNVGTDPTTARATTTNGQQFGDRNMGTVDVTVGRPPGRDRVPERSLESGMRNEDDSFKPNQLGFENILQNGMNNISNVLEQGYENFKKGLPSAVSIGTASFGSQLHDYMRNQGKFADTNSENAAEKNEGYGDNPWARLLKGQDEPNNDVMKNDVGGSNPIDGEGTGKLQQGIQSNQMANKNVQQPNNSPYMYPMPPVMYPPFVAYPQGNFYDYYPPAPPSQMMPPTYGYGSAPNSFFPPPFMMDPQTAAGIIPNTGMPNYQTGVQGNLPPATHTIPGPQIAGNNAPPTAGGLFNQPPPPPNGPAPSFMDFGFMPPQPPYMYQGYPPQGPPAQMFYFQPANVGGVDTTTGGPYNNGQEQKKGISPSENFGGAISSAQSPQPQQQSIQQQQQQHSFQSGGPGIASGYVILGGDNGTSGQGIQSPYQGGFVAAPQQSKYGSQQPSASPPVMMVVKNQYPGDMMQYMSNQIRQLMAYQMALQRWPPRSLRSQQASGSSRLLMTMNPRDGKLISTTSSSSGNSPQASVARFLKQLRSLGGTGENRLEFMQTVSADLGSKSPFEVSYTVPHRYTSHIDGEVAPPFGICWEKLSASTDFEVTNVFLNVSTEEVEHISSTDILAKNSNPFLAVMWAGQTSHNDAGCAWIPMCYILDQLYDLDAESPVEFSVTIRASPKDTKTPPSSPLRVKFSGAGLADGGHWAQTNTTTTVEEPTTAGRTMSHEYKNSAFFAFELPSFPEGTESTDSSTVGEIRKDPIVIKTLLVQAVASNDGPKFTFSQADYDSLSPEMKKIFDQIIMEMGQLDETPQQQQSGTGTDPKPSTSSSSALPVSAGHFTFLPRIVVDNEIEEGGRTIRKQMCLPMPSGLTGDSAADPGSKSLGREDPLEMALERLITTAMKQTTTAVRIRTFLEGVPMQALFSSQEGNAPFLLSNDLSMSAVNWNVQITLKPLSQDFLAMFNDFLNDYDFVYDLPPFEVSAAGPAPVNNRLLRDDGDRMDGFHRDYDNNNNSYNGKYSPDYRRRGDDRDYYPNRAGRRGDKYYNGGRDQDYRGGDDYGRGPYRNNREYSDRNYNDRRSKYESVDNNFRQGSSTGSVNLF